MKEESARSRQNGLESANIPPKREFRREEREYSSKVSKSPPFKRLEVAGPARLASGGRI